MTIDTGTCTWRPFHDAAHDVPYGPACGERATHVIRWLDGSGRYSPACAAHLELDADAPPHRIEALAVTQ